ncbi:MAG: hypothetical protein AAF125_11225, partial [Chloroflexota bacterium]
MAQGTMDRPSGGEAPRGLEVEAGKLRRDMAIRGAGRVGLWLNPVATYFFLWAPILLLVMFSFNDSRSVSVWRGFTTEWYTNIFDNTIGDDASFSTSLLIDSVQVSIVVAVTATAISTV